MVILCDFDKTITLQDSTDEMVKLYDKEKLKNIIARYRAGEINIKVYLQECMDIFGSIEKEKFNELMGTNVALDPGFKDFLDMKYDYRIVSAGTKENIRAVFAKYGISVPEERIYANTLDFNRDGIKVNFIYDANCGFCGVCKRKIVEEYKEKYAQTIYIGDGTSDICGAKYADIVFARKGDKLSKVFDEEGRDYYEYQDFWEIIEKLKEISR